MSKAKVYFCDEYDFDSEKGLALLPEERLARYHRFRFEDDKKNCLGAYLLLVKALKEQGVEQFELCYSENGKPGIQDNPVFFNLSHSKKGFVCAVHSKEIGVDIQTVAAAKEITLNRICSADEKIAVSDDAVKFTRLWTFKESIIKKRGETVFRYSQYRFPEIKKDFFAYDNHFVSFDDGNSVITVCGEFDEAELIKIKSSEL